MIDASPLALHQRHGLPDALRVLLETYPRDRWEQADGFDGLIRFWLERHLMFRRLLEAIATDAKSRLDGAIDPQTHAARLTRFGGLFVNELHMHHHIEDSHYFPKLKTMDARLSHGFDLLDKDHDAMDGILQNFAETANAALVADPAADAFGALDTEVSTVTRLLNRHLTDEEELVVPVLLTYGTESFQH